MKAQPLTSLGVDPLLEELVTSVGDWHNANAAFRKADAVVEAAHGQVDRNYLIAEADKSAANKNIFTKGGNLIHYLQTHTIDFTIELAGAGKNLVTARVSVADYDKQSQAKALRMLDVLEIIAAAEFKLFTPDEEVDLAQLYKGCGAVAKLAQGEPSIYRIGLNHFALAIRQLKGEVGIYVIDRLVEEKPGEPILEAKGIKVEKALAAVHGIETWRDYLRKGGYTN